MSKGVLYVVATPIGNLGDISMRAVEILREVDLIAAEDTRHTKPLLRHYAIDTPMQSFHEHNERAQVAKLTEVLQSGRSVALVSDAGTPLISDPGFPLVREAAGLGIRIVPVPGPSAMICALSAAGLPTDRFLFAGFPPRNQGQRRDWLGELIRERATLVFYESSHRIVASLKAMVEVFGGEREAVIAREVTKLHETFLRGSLDELLSQVEQDENQRKGEFVILVAGAPAGSTGVQAEIVVDQLLSRLLDELPLKRAVALVAELTGNKKNKLYDQALRIKESRV
ncbi:MAG: 16S rRNA (cytidine(1402)-2'-O)-methyltransferase [Candidatus Thiodiazotropha sp. (ex Myrtea sp. 'scaly one' KF741663)]|nr:16S rRNA (cytidine(1402)-2'-O)-methyltransferase [Candidatus Thiodiazotropha sp. (ex Myrtea sp. 'scaly one' KF741663)]